ncbi:hypothetical protein T03_2590 [Trichinella britovi]|uniref:Uncharacterized protein n=1 Tax=Trichinella britovi TaxID=45882 RepID=A0A0V1CVI0_TRIBR|nr:hypothetical protein T03_2590 [Trichinella britovi]
MIKVKLPQVQCDKSDDKIFHRWPVPPFGWLFSAPLSNNKINSQLLRHDYAKLNSPQKHVGGRAVPADGAGLAPTWRRLGADDGGL